MNPDYLEYDSLANTGLDSVFCLTLSVPGCTNSIADNFNENANFNDGSCTGIQGCTNSLAINYDSSADTEVRYL